MVFIRIKLCISGSRTIRTEEAILISLAALTEKLEPLHRPRDFDLSHSIPQSEDTGMKPAIHGSGMKRKHKNSTPTTIPEST